MNTPQTAPQPGINAWLEQHLYSLTASLGRALRKPWATLLTIGVMAVALSLPLGLGLALANVERFAGNVQQARVLSVFLQQDTEAARVAALADELRAWPEVASLEWRTPEAGLQNLRQNPALADAIDQLEDNPLPHLFILTPRDDEAALAERLKTLPESDLVQHDALWRERLDQWLAFGERLAWVLAILLGAGALLVVGNTVRLDIQSRKEEIGVLQLLGATDGFIRRPFLYLGAWYGLAAGVLALGFLALAHHYLAGPLGKLAASYASSFALQGLSLGQAGMVIVAAGLLGWLGAGIVAGHFLRQTRPER
ncbi:cell division protein FtsX [Lysobacteraceae bacterium NML120232]|nr:cell division protein FtsX [Xanthomonadaceae bacterium NML08-0793]PJK12453.1 cell division protein FtsX [Xanthomonadaceae bacterium NML120232]